MKHLERGNGRSQKVSDFFCISLKGKHTGNPPEAEDILNLGIFPIGKYEGKSTGGRKRLQF